MAQMDTQRQRPKLTTNKRQSSRKRKGHCKMEKIVEQIMPTIGRGPRTDYDIPMEERDKPRPILESQRMNCASLSTRYKID